MKQVMNRGTIDTAQLLVERGAIYPQMNSISLLQMARSILYAC
jgi:hypothetical protein